MCATVTRGVRTLTEAWEAERARQRASTLHCHAEWDAVRERLLEGLRAIHLVCTAGVVQDIGDLRTGLKTMQEACSAAAVRPAMRSMVHLGAFCARACPCTGRRYGVRVQHSAGASARMCRTGCALAQGCERA